MADNRTLGYGVALGGPAPQAAGTAVPGLSVTLHPNLARIAATYQRICDRFARGEIDSVVAATEIRELIARDDEGVQWTINPKDGGWLYLAKSGRWTPGTPPESGLATLTPHDVSARGVAGGREVYDPDRDISWRQVHDGGTGLAGVTRRRAYQPPREIERPRWLYPALAAALVAVAVLVGLMLLDRGGTQEPPGTTLPGLSAPAGAPPAGATA